MDGFDARLFEQEHPNGLEATTYVATAFQFDDGGRPLEMGSSLTEYLHTLDFLVLGHTAVWGRNVAQIIKSVLRTERGALPLRDYNVATDPRPILDWMEVDEVSAQREFSFDPRPWNTHAWTTRLRIYDCTYASDYAVP
jgi:hypothetical protein